ncbi:MAG TPA: hypothetical protein PKY82_27015 [Pyrinomonadaceae bacterium]|nr:hypothetical protein [Pyrinomonadaceae bacterium]
MPLQNRVNPFGDLCFSENRGTFTGNRGVIHNEKQEIVKQFRVKRWIVCLLKYKDYQRKVMTPNRWTELFFLDEATALAAGHRPCTFCQRQRSIEFRQHWVTANQAFFDISDIKVDAIDDILHQERMNLEKPFVRIDDLPDGVFVEFNGKPNLIFEEQLFEWSFAGYLHPQAKPSKTLMKLLTPPSTVRAIRNGFQPIMFNKK